MILFCTPIPVIEGPCGPRRAPITVEWHRCVTRILAPFGHSFSFQDVEGQRVDDARNMAAQNAIDRKAEYLFFLDYDVLVVPSIVHRLVQQMANNPQIDVISGVYCSKTDFPSPLIFKEGIEGPFWDWCPGDLLIDGITCCSMGCSLIRVSLFERLPKPWFKTVKDTNDGLHWTMKSEDNYFCANARTNAGATIAVDTELVCGHIDNATGKVYMLPGDSIPGRRYKAKMEGEN